MRLGIAIAFFILISSCASKEENKQTVSDQIRVSLDTVMVDTGDEFLYLQDFLSNSSLSHGGDYFFNFDRKGFFLEKINLNNLSLDRKIKFEKEGPYGINTDNPRFLILQNGNLFFFNYKIFKEFDQSAGLIKDLKLDEIAKEYLDGFDNYVTSIFEDKQNPNRFICLILNWESFTYFLFDFDLTNQSFRKIDLPESEKYKQYRVQINQDGKDIGGYGGQMQHSIGGGKILLSSNAFNEVQVFDILTDSLFSIKWDTPLLGSKRSYVPPKEVEGFKDEFSEVSKKSDEDISYKNFLWDDKNERYLRFSEKKKFGIDKNEFGSYISTGSDVYLSIFDKDFKLISEAQLPKLTSLSMTHFVKDGNIWMYENIDDELAFVILKIEEV
ncbi:DUF4221 family protein [Algoriphagus sp. D3-2-R+10]|uniref:DUF4221 family protein n=1 Tax=Algoriphagus aurantiacus TaxID=3103948 RepID=UPI002B36FE74|nr:DUF4221 family protein [Algoriphagus sp. D3-2-R+10]MEB2775553.1 DUF4221 family protein [Algoriphagus sp. D3-2-R+10]